VAILNVTITEEQAEQLETLDGRVMLGFVMTGCDGKLRVSDYEREEDILECTIEYTPERRVELQRQREMDNYEDEQIEKKFDC
jgi:hypothetical protein